MESPLVYLVFLVDVGRNSATFAVDTVFNGNSSDDPKRVANALRGDRIAKVLDSMDRAPHEIKSWMDFYCWLGRPRQWAEFTEESAKRLVPHWFTEYECQPSGSETFAYIDRNCGVDPRLLVDLKLEGNADEANAKRFSSAIGNNLVVTTQPLFP